MSPVKLRINPTVDPADLCDLREAVGWGGLEADYPAALAGYWGTVAAFDEAEGLIGWCAILSDGVRHAVLLDVIIHPTWQRQGVGRQIVKRAVEHIRQHGISIIHVDFTPENRGFYEACGFRIGLAGILEVC